MPSEQTKKKRSTRRADADLDDMQVDETSIVPLQRNLDSNFVDDDDLQAALARSRRAKLQKPNKLSPEEVARKSQYQPNHSLYKHSLTVPSYIVAEEREQAMVTDGPEVIKVEDEDGEGGLEFDDTSEFVRAITYDPIAVKKEPTETRATAASSKQLSEPREVGMKVDEDEAMEELEAGEVVVKEEEDEEAMLNAIESTIKEVEAAEQAGNTQGDNVGTSSEQTFSSGMAATLSLLRNQGVLAAANADADEREKVQIQRDAWLADYRRMLSHREFDRARMRGGNKDQATREYENRQRDSQEAKATTELFKNYKPDVEISYFDEFGRKLNPKEAWKALSHKFHGKGSGKMKTEKRLKKIAEEKKKEAMASGDTPLSMNQAFQTRQEKAGQAHFVLSVGNRGYVPLDVVPCEGFSDMFSTRAVPQAAEFLDAQPLSKGKTEKKNKKKNANQAASQLDSTGFITLPAPLINSGMASPAIGSANGSPAPRPGFSRISSTAVDNTSLKVV